MIKYPNLVYLINNILVIFLAEVKEPLKKSNLDLIPL